jgi:hypothetical protein
MKNLFEYINESTSKINYTNTKHIEVSKSDMLPLPKLSSEFKRFIDKYDFKPVVGSELEKSIGHAVSNGVRYYPTIPLETIGLLDYFKVLSNGNYLTLTPYCPDNKPDKLTDGLYFSEYVKGSGSSTVRIKRYGKDGYTHNPKELETIYNNEIEK